MPVFVIGLLNNFVFNPILFNISCMWEESRVKDFMRSVIRQTLIVIVITLICIIGKYAVGIPVLSFLYNTDLSDYRVELILLLVGGGLLGESGVYTMILTIMRKQKSLMLEYGGIAIFALFASSPVVRLWGMLGAVLLYDGLMLALCVVFIIMIGCYMRRL